MLTSRHARRKQYVADYGDLVGSLVCCVFGFCLFVSVAGWFAVVLVMLLLDLFYKNWGGGGDCVYVCVCVCVGGVLFCGGGGGGVAVFWVWGGGGEPNLISLRSVFHSVSIWYLLNVRERTFTVRLRVDFKRDNASRFGAWLVKQTNITQVRFRFPSVYPSLQKVWSLGAILYFCPTPTSRLLTR